MRAVFWDGRKARPVDVPEWVTFTAPADLTGTGHVVEGRCARCSVPLDLPSGASRAETERALGAYALRHARCAAPDARASFVAKIRSMRAEWRARYANLGAGKATVTR